MKYGWNQGSWLTLGMCSLHNLRSVKVSFNGYSTKRYLSLSGVYPQPATWATSLFCHRALDPVEAEVPVSTEGCPRARPVLRQGQVHGTAAALQERHRWGHSGTLPAAPASPAAPLPEAAPLGCPLAAGPGRGADRRSVTKYKIREFYWFICNVRTGIEISHLTENLELLSFQALFYWHSNTCILANE